MFLKTTMRKISTIKIENRINKKSAAHKKRKKNNVEDFVSNKHLIKLKFQQNQFRRRFVNEKKNENAIDEKTKKKHYCKRR